MKKILQIKIKEVRKRLQIKIENTPLCLLWYADSTEPLGMPSKQDSNAEKS